MSSTSNPRVQLIDSQGDPMDSASDNALKVKLVDTDVEITVDASELSVHLEAANDDVLIYGNDYAGSPANQKLKVDSSGFLYIKRITDTVNCALHAADGTAITESSGQLDVNIAGAGTSVTVAQASSARTIVGTVTVDLGSNNDVTVTSGNVGHDITGMAQGTTTGGTSAMQLDEGTDGYSVACKRIDLTSRYTNTGDIYVGSADTISANPVSIVGGVRLSAGDFYSIDINNLTHIWVEASQADQELDFIYYT